MRVENGFKQQSFTEPHAFLTDPVLPALLLRLLPPNILDPVVADCTRLGDIISTKLRPLGSKVSPPKLVQYDQWGKRIDDLQTSEGWRTLKAICQREGIPGIFYEREYGEYSRIYGFAKMLLMMGDSHTVFCPLSMTDGCARTLELLGTPDMKQRILPRLVSRDPSLAFTSGQWMTERPGGSDVSQTETTAHWLGKTNRTGPLYTLDGFKWFSSATDSQLSLALARTGPPNSGSRGLSLFLVPLRMPLFPELGQETPETTSNGVFVHRLKNKIGTHALPTAELAVEGSTAYLLGKPGEGVKNITSVLNITRIYSAISSIGALRRCLAIATAYSEVRTVSGGKQRLNDTPIHVEELARINLTYRALTHFAFGVIRLIGRSECLTSQGGHDQAEEEMRRLRVLTCTVKAFAAELAVSAMQDAMCALGGAGYMEENEIGRLIRDAMVEKIWEGTTSVLALELSRAVQNPSTLSSFTSWASSILSACPRTLHSNLTQALTILSDSLSSLEALKTQTATTTSPLHPRPLLMLIGYIASSIYLLEHAIWSHSREDANANVDEEVFRRWVCEGGLTTAAEEWRRVMKESQEGRTGERVKKSGEIVFGIHKMKDDVSAKL